MANKTLIATLTGDTFKPASGLATIQYVGGRGAGRAGSVSSVNVAINSGLAGGIGTAALEGDVVVVTVAVATQGRNPECGVSGWTQKTQQHETATTYDISVRTSYKLMTSTPDTQVTIPATGNVDDGQGYVIHVFRNVDPSNIEDVTAQYASGSATNNRPDPASITTATAGAWLYFGGGGAAANGTTVFTISYASGVLSYNGADTNDGTVGAGYYTGATPSTPYDGAAFGGGSVNANNSWGCTVLALRPKATTPFDDARQDAIDGVVSAQAEAHGWNAERTNIPVTALSRTADDIATLIIPSLPAYDITAQEELIWTLPASILAGGAAIVATPTFTIDPTGGEPPAVGASIFGGSICEGAIMAGPVVR